MPAGTISSLTSTSSANPTAPRAAAISTPNLQGLGTRIFLATATVIVVVLGGALLLTKRGADQAADDSLSRALTATRLAVQDGLDSRSRVLLKVTGGQTRVPAYIAQLSQATENSGADLLDRAGEFKDQSGASWALITGPAGVALAWTLHRDAAGEDFSEGAVVGQALEGEPTQGVWIEPADSTDVLYQAVGVPVKDPNSDKIYGVLVTALAIDSAFVRELKLHTGSEIAFFDRDSTGAPHVSLSTLPKGPLDQALAKVSLDSIFADTTSHSFHLTAAGESFVGVLGPLRTADGHAVAGFAALRPRGVELAAYTALRRTMIVVFGAGLVLALLSALLVARQVTQPVRRLVSLTRMISEGQYPETFDVASQGEVGELASAFQRMVADLKQKQELVDYLSQSAGVTPTVTTLAASDATKRMSTPIPVTGQLRPGVLLAERYEIKELLGSGGMGVVYRAWDRQLQEPVAIKTLRNEALQTDANILERFKQEIRLARRISHRNVLRTHDLGEVDGTYFITMEYAEGTSLAELLSRRGALPVGVTLAIGKQLCRALEVAHEAGVVHRDIKPQNLMIDAAGSLKVMDFGIARLAEAGRPRSGAALTEVGTMIGTPEYMSPEQLMAGEVDGRSDLYAAGAVLFECLTGRRVFVEPTVTALIAAHLQDAPPDPRLLNGEVPDALAAVILTSLAKSREDRFVNAEAMFDALEAVRI